MTTDTQAAAKVIAAKLAASENQIDKALASSAELLASLAQSRLEADAEFATGHVAMLRLIKSLTALSTARGDMIRAHAELRKVAEERGEYWVTPCPSAAATTTSAEIRLVA